MPTPNKRATNALNPRLTGIDHSENGSLELDRFEFDMGKSPFRSPPLSSTFSLCAVTAITLTSLNKWKVAVLLRHATEKEAVMLRAAILTIAAVVISLPWGTQPVQARDAPWCAVIANGDDNSYWDCQYFSYETCRSVVLAGNRGWCNPSPYATPAAQEKPSAKRRGRPN
jgi:hypothetical protein